MSFNTDMGEDEEEKDEPTTWPEAAQNIGCYICIVLIIAIWAFVEINT